MSSSSSNLLNTFKKKNSLSATAFAKKSHLFIKQHLFSQECSDREENNHDSSQSKQDHPQNDPKIIWSHEEDLHLIALFRELGTNWQEISTRLFNKNVFEIKRHFGKILRKVIQNQNKIQREKGEKEINLKRIKLALQASGEQLGQPLNKDGSGSIIKDQIYKIIYQFLTSKGACQINAPQSHLESLRNIILLLKRSRKKRHGSKASTDIYFKSQIQSDQFERGYASDSSSVFQEPKEMNQPHNSIRNHQSHFADEEEMHESISLPLNGVIVEQSEERIKDLLRESGVLQVEECAISSSKNISINFQQSIASSSQNLNNESYQHFYEDSQLEHDCYWKKSCSDFRNMD